MWLPVFVCTCGHAMGDGAAGADALVCRACGTRVDRIGQVFRCLEPARRARVEPFLAQYRLVRMRDGYRADRADYYRALPSAPSADPQSAVWTIRRRSFRRLVRALRARKFEGAPALLDLGAGNGWLSHRLVKAGCRAVAVDVLADDCDGLGASRHYDVAFACVEADFDALPFAPSQFDVVVFNGSLHYAPDVHATLRGADRMLLPGGMLVVIDSPMFARHEDGQAMRERQRIRFRQDYDLPAPVEPGEGFLTFARLDAAAAAMGRLGRFFPSHDGWRSRVRRLMGSRTNGAASPQFGVWVAA